MLGSLRMLKDLRMSMSKPICWCHPPVQGIFPSLQKLVLSLVPLASLSHSLESAGFNFQWVGLRDELQESPIFQWENRWFPVLVDFPLSQWHTHTYIYMYDYICMYILSSATRMEKMLDSLCHLFPGLTATGAHQRSHRALAATSPIAISPEFPVFSLQS